MMYVVFVVDNFCIDNKYFGQLVIYSMSVNITVLYVIRIHFMCVWNSGPFYQDKIVSQFCYTMKASLTKLNVAIT